MHARRFHLLLLIYLAIGALAALTVLVYRHQAEAGNRNVELTADYGQIVALAAAAGGPLPSALTELKAAGLTSVALTEESVGDLIAAGVVRAEQEILPGSLAPVTVARFVDAGSRDRVTAHLLRRLRLPKGVEKPSGQVLMRSPDRKPALYPVPWDVLRALDIGLSPEERARVVDAGLGIVSRVGNFTGASGESIRWMLGQLHSGGARVVVFTGDEVLGHRARVKETAAALDEAGLIYGSVELGKQRGDEELSKALDSRIVRVHSVQTVEMAKLTTPTAIERYVRAVRERNIRLAYLRLITAVADDPLAQNVALVRGVAEELRARGFQPGAVTTFDPVLPAMGPLNRLLPALVALLIVGGGMMLLATLAPIPPSRQLLPALIFGVLAVAAAIILPGLSRKLLALAATVIFPTLAFTLWPPSASPTNDERRTTNKSGPSLVVGRWSFVVGRFLAISAVSLLGGLAVVGLLSDRSALVKVSEFSGIKVAQALPLLALAAIVVGDLWSVAPTWEAKKRGVVTRFERFLGEPLRLWHAVAALLGLVALALMLLRTGNDPGVGVSPLELRFRSLLEEFLVRPRTKEFLLGHPALILALALWSTGRGRLLVPPLLLVGAIGQAGMVNSFCHLHTPIALTLARTWNGLWLGALIGLAIALVIPRKGFHHGEHREHGERAEKMEPIRPSPVIHLRVLRVLRGELAFPSCDRV